MSKKINEQAITATGNLRKYMSEYSNVSLRKLASVTGLCYNWLLKKSKEPIKDQPYDPENFNYDAVERVFISKEIDLTTIDWESLNQVSASTALPKNLDMFQVGCQVYLRDDNVRPYTICYKTATHVVAIKEGETEPHCWGNNTFLMKGPVFSPRTKNESNNEEVEDPQ